MIWVRDRIFPPSASTALPNLPPQGDGRVERRAVGHVELRGAGGFRGTVMEYGTTGGYAGGPERFEPGSLRVVPPAAMNLQHDPAMVLDPAPVYTSTEARVTLTGVIPRGAAELVRRGSLGGLSVEFVARSERLDKGVRVIESADLVAVGLVDRGAYPLSKAVA